MGKNIGKNISKNLSGEYSHKLLDRAKLSAIDALKTSSKRAIQITAEAIGDLIDNKTPDKIMIVCRTSQENNLEAVTNEHDKEILKERCISPKERQKIIDDLRLT